MQQKTHNRIINYIKKNGQATGSELTNFLNISDRAVRKQLSKMLENNILTKIGKPPKVFYMLKNVEVEQKIHLNKKVADLINDNYLSITPIGERLEGVNGFAFWCQRNNLPVEKTAKEYVQTYKKYQQYKKKGLIDGMVKFKNSFAKVYLDKIFYFDFYSIERFGKTKLGQMLLYGKQSGNKKLIKSVVDIIRPSLDILLSKYKFDVVAYVPWTVKREVQFMKQLEKQLNIPLKTIVIDKVKTDIIVPQKTLSKISDRIANAKQTLVVRGNHQYKTILLIDDAVGSGATLNEVAKQLKDRKIAKKVIGLAITGSFKGFDIISEV